MHGLKAKFCAGGSKSTTKKDAPADADDHKGEDGKFEKSFSAEPGGGD